MATYQTSYGASQAHGLPGLVANSELSNRISRTVESAAGIEFGQPAFRGSGDHGCVLGATFAASASAAAVAGNTGDGAMGAVTPTAGAKEGRYKVTVIEPGTNAGKFSVEDPDGAVIGNGTVAVAFSAGGIAFTLADGATDFIAGDAFNIDVTFTANADYLGLAILNPAVPAASSTPDKYPQYFTAALLTEGQMWVTAGATVADGDDVYWNPSTKRFTNTTTHVRIPGAKFDTSAVDGGLVEISLKLR